MNKPISEAEQIQFIKNNATDHVVELIKSLTIMFEFVNVDQVQQKVNHYFECLKVTQRFEQLKDKANGSLSLKNYADSNGGVGYLLDEHQFKTLDEVEKALNNKAFL
jgi:hypothetical protein